MRSGRNRIGFLFAVGLLASVMLASTPSPCQASIPDILDDPTLQLLFPAAELRDLVGYNGPRTYLFIGQNSYELRPTGGFISRVGLIRFVDGSPEIVWMKYTYELDNRYKEWVIAHPEDADPQTPPDVYYLFGTSPIWYMRDRNWWPDFKVTAQELLSIFAQEARAYNSLVPEADRIPMSEPYTGVDGVIAVDLEVGSSILGVTGAVTLDAPGKAYDGAILNAQNFGPFCQWWENSKGASEAAGFFNALADAMREKLDTAPSDKQGALAMAFVRLLSQHHMIMYSKTARNQSALERLNWAGRSPSLPGDFLHVSDANIGGRINPEEPWMGNKVNMYVRRSVGYGVTLRYDNTSRHAADVSWQNLGTTGYFDYIDDPNDPEPNYSILENAYYRGWNRLFTPASAVLDEGGSQYEGVLEDKYDAKMARRYFASWVGLNGLYPDETQTAVYQYALKYPLLSVPNGYRYRLQVQKQAGTDAEGFRLNFYSPYLFPIGAWGASGLSRSSHNVRFNGDLEYDKVIEVSLVPGVMSRPAPVIRYGRVTRFSGLMSPYHIKPVVYVDVYRRVGRRYVRERTVGVRVSTYTSTTRKYLLPYRPLGRGYYHVRTRFPARYGSKVFYSPWKTFRVI